jgi:hydroxyacylglutathione hydrolase
MQIHPLLARSDNWMYLVVDEASNEAAVVDPYDWKKMLGLVKEKGVNVSVKQCMTEREEG